METEKEVVAIVKCKSYKQKNVDKAIRKLLRLLNFDTKNWKKVLIKPNVLGVYGENQEAIVTNPSIVKALMKEFKGRQLIGESSFMDTEKAFEHSGYKDFINKIVFEQEKLIHIKDEKAEILKSFYLPKIVKKADLIINVPKLKTHTLTKMTGAIKNLYGCIPGGMKQVLHRKAHGDKFSHLLVDIYQNIKPGLNIMDAVIGMEGEGPSAGKPKYVGLLLASRNAVSLDIAAAKIIGYKASEIPAIKDAVERNLASYKIKIIGDVKKIKSLKFKKPLIIKRSLARSILVKLVKDNPICVKEDKCTKCYICAKKCPMKAITLKPYPVIDTKKCIRCFCCIEVCPHHALYLKEQLRKLKIKLKN